MITLWRIEKRKYIDSFLLGEGSRLYPGRWNKLGTPIVYTSDSMSLAAWEKYVHISRVTPGKIPMCNVDLVALEISAPDDIITADVSNLGYDWMRLNNIKITQVLGSEWYHSKASLLLEVPTAIMPRGVNYLINSSHPLVKDIKIKNVIDFKFDIRII
ncbi:MAG: RES family NAD+ phosphorylase [Melioribacteraceae bacterium]|nr:RES family NAD+ phosphorylase [Melioribacteraceae bacterium]